jgi:myo-inositol-1(or 4)-monophosphatase
MPRNASKKKILPLDLLPMKPTLSDVETLARGAGKILRECSGQQLHIKQTGVIDLVTEADQRSEAYLVGEIRQRYPTHRIIAEESGELAGVQEHIWYIDPLDGTLNYAHGLPIYAVSIAYEENGQVVLGVVYDPERDECFSAERGCGAWLNGARLEGPPAQELDHSLLVTGFPYDIRTNPVNNLDHYAAFALRSYGVRRLGSAAIDLGYVAAGRFDGYWELRINSWDVAAGGLIAQEAGATVTNVAGSPAYLTPPYSILAASPRLHTQMLAVLNADRQK